MSACAAPEEHVYGALIAQSGSVEQAGQVEFVITYSFMRQRTQGGLTTISPKT